MTDTTGRSRDCGAYGFQMLVITFCIPCLVPRPRRGYLTRVWWTYDISTAALIGPRVSSGRLDKSEVTGGWKDRCSHRFATCISGWHDCQIWTLVSHPLPGALGDHRRSMVLLDLSAMARSGGLAGSELVTTTPDSSINSNESIWPAKQEHSMQTSAKLHMLTSLDQ